jgi:hypothetical protein
VAGAAVGAVSACGGVSGGGCGGGGLRWRRVAVAAAAGAAAAAKRMFMCRVLNAAQWTSTFMTLF